jgi:hypothetical protein
MKKPEKEIFLENQFSSDIEGILVPAGLKGH